MQLSQAIYGFLLDGSAGKLSSRTVDLYRYCLNNLVKHAGDVSLEAITHEKLTLFMVYLKTEYTAKTKTGKLSGPVLDNHWKAIRSFFKWCAKTLKNPDPSINLTRPRYASAEIVPFTEAEAKRIVAAVEKTKLAQPHDRASFQMTRPTAARDRALILLMLDTGLRIGEITRLEIKDVTLETGEVHVKPYETGIKSFPRTVFLGKNARMAVWKYLTTRPGAQPDESLFELKIVSIQSLLMRIEQRTGIPNIHAHRFRHTFAVMYLRNGGDVFTLQRLLGHSSLEMVRRYVALADSDAAEAHRRASPADRMKL